jgi:hypothetical protein
LDNIKWTGSPQESPPDVDAYAKRLAEGMVRAIQELESQECDGPRWLLLFTNDPCEFRTNLNSKVAEALNSSGVTLVVNVAGVPMVPTGLDTDLMIAANYSGGSVIAVEDGDAVDSIFESFASRVSALTESKYRMTWFDANFNKEPLSRTYRTTFKRNDVLVRTEILHAPDQAILRSFREEHWATASKIIMTGSRSELHGVVQDLYGHYNLAELEPLMEQVHSRAARWALSDNTATGIDLLQRLERIYEGKDPWRMKFRSDYEDIGDYFVKNGNRSGAIPHYQKSISYAPTQDVYEKLLKCQFDVFDFDGAKASAEWIYVNGDLGAGVADFVRTMALVYSGGLRFEKAESLVRRVLVNLRDGDPFWWYPVLATKAYWFTASARTVGSVMPRIRRPSDFMEVVEELDNLTDVMWIVFANVGGTIEYSSNDGLLGRKLQDISSVLKAFPLSGIRRPIFLASVEATGGLGLVLVPCTCAHKRGFIALCFDTYLKEPSETMVFASLVKHPADEKIWRTFKSRLDHRCGTAMTKTLGRIYQTMELTPETWLDRLIDVWRLFEEERVVYSVVSGREGGLEGPVTILRAKPAGISEKLLSEEKANTSPYFMFVERHWKGKELIEFTTAVYGGDKWLGTQRVGYRR